MKLFLYKFHKQIAYFIFIPILLWVISGVMHPFMSNFFRPSIANKFYKEQVIDTTQLSISLKDALLKNKLNTFNNARVIYVNNQAFYQVKKEDQSVAYISANDGTISENKDIQYAKELARYFLDDQETNITSTELITEFTTYYKPINRLLPVYKVSFDSPNKMNVYVDTRSSKLGTFNNSYRKAYIWIFHTFHNWGIIPNNFLRTFLVSSFSLLTLLTAIVGIWIYGLGYKNFKKQKVRNDYLKKRKSHRVYGIVFSVFCLMFSFSGFYHATKKFTPDNRHTIFDTHSFKTNDLGSNINEILANNKATNFSFQSIKNQPVLRIQTAKRKSKHFNVTDAQVINNGDLTYAKELASKFSKKSLKDISNTSFIKKFGGEYGFVNKLLPVYKIDFNTNDNLSYYIEPKSGKLASKVTNADRLEGFSFAFLHKFHFLDALGKTPRDLFAIIAALSMLLVAFKGWKIRKRK